VVGLGDEDSCDTQGPCNMPVLRVVRGAKKAVIHGNTQGAECYMGGGANIKRPYFNTLDGLWLMFSW